MVQVRQQLSHEASSKFGRSALTLVSKVDGTPGSGGIHLGDRTGGDERPGLFILPNIVATGRSVASHDALCVEVLKTSAGLGLSLDGGKSSMAGDGPLVIKRVYKGNALKNPVSSLVFFPFGKCSYSL